MSVPYSVDDMNRTVYMWSEADISQFVANGYKVVRVIPIQNDDPLKALLDPRVA